MKRGANFLLAWALGIYAVLYLPIVVMAVNSFNSSRYPQRWGGFTLHWYAEMFRDEDVLSSLWTSLVVSVISTLIATLLGTATAMAMRNMEKAAAGGRTNRRSISGLIEGVLMMPVILPDIVIGLSLLLLFVFVRVQLGLTTVILSHITFSMVYVFLVVRVRLKSLDPALEEAAYDLGATSLQTFRKVTLPLLLPGIVAGALLAFTLSFEDFLITFFTAGVGTTTLPIQIYSMMKFGVSPVISALSTSFLFLILLSTLLTQRYRLDRR